MMKNKNWFKDLLIGSVGSILILWSLGYVNTHPKPEPSRIVMVNLDERNTTDSGYHYRFRYQIVDNCQVGGIEAISEYGGVKEILPILVYSRWTLEPDSNPRLMALQFNIPQNEAGLGEYNSVEIRAQLVCDGGNLVLKPPERFYLDEQFN